MSATANLTWDPALGAVSYKVEYKLQSSSSYILFSNSIGVNSCIISGLQEGNAYDFRITTNCVSLSAGGLIISGSTPCKDVSGIGSSFSGNTANLVWDKKPTAQSYIIEYKLQSSGTYITAPGSPLNNTGLPDPVLFSISGLTSGSAYDFRVKVNCLQGTSTGVVTSSTSVCPNVSNLQVTFS